MAGDREMSLILGHPYRPVYRHRNLMNAYARQHLHSMRIHVTVLIDVNSTCHLSDSLLTFTTIVHIISYTP